MDANEYNAWNDVHLWDSDSGAIQEGYWAMPPLARKKSAMTIA